MANDESTQVVSEMTPMIKDSDTDVRLSTVILLGQIMNQKLHGGAHPYPWEGSQAKALGEFKPQANRIIAAVIESLADTNAAVRAAAAYALGDTGPFDKAEDAKTVTALTRALTDENKDVRGRAISAVENFGAEAKDAVPVLAAMIGGREEGNQLEPQSRGLIDGQFEMVLGGRGSIPGLHLELILFPAASRHRDRRFGQHLPGLIRHERNPDGQGAPGIAPGE